ncbi:MAG: membrane protein insertase YidC, partial [Rhodospirillales bacterium]
MMENKNIILAVALSIAILFGWEAYVSFTKPPAPPATETTAEAGAPTPNLPAPGSEAMAPAAAGGTPQAPGALPGIAGQRPNQNEALMAAGGRVKISTPRLHGSFNLRGLRLDDLTLANYRETQDADSAEIVLLTPQTGTAGYFAEFGWVGGSGQSVKLPDAEAIWSADREELTPDAPVTLTWDNGEGLTFHKKISVDGNYLFTVERSVENSTGAPVTLYPYGLVSRHGTPHTTGFYILHEGPLGVFDGTLAEVDYDDLSDDGPVEKKSTGGWIGITDKYWLTALVPDQKEAVTSRFTHRKDGTLDKYQTDYLGAPLVVPAGGSTQVTGYLFAGAKELDALEGYQESLGIKNFDLAIDFGWFYFLTKPLFHALIWLNSHLGNYGVAILVLTVIVKLAFFPLANKSYRSMSKMRALQPKMEKLRERFGDDKQRLNQEMMQLYKKEKVNPASGCLPIIVQIPVFFALYKVLFVCIEMRHAPFFGWIHDLSAPDPTSVFNLFGLIDWMPPDVLMIGVWPLIMGATMFLQQKLNPQPADPIQAKIFLFLPVMFTFMLARFPAGLVIYWAWNNALSIAQQK